MKEIESGPVEATELHVKPHLPVLGPKLGKELGSVRAALAAGEFEQLEGDGFRVLGHDLGPEEVLVERSGKEGWAVASNEGVTVAINPTLDAELELEGRVYDLNHALNSMRKDQGLELSDQITVTLHRRTQTSSSATPVDQGEVLAVSLETDGVRPRGSRRSEVRRRWTGGARLPGRDPVGRPGAMPYDDRADASATGEEPKLSGGLVGFGSPATNTRAGARVTRVAASFAARKPATTIYATDRVQPRTPTCSRGSTGPPRAFPASTSRT